MTKKVQTSLISSVHKGALITRREAALYLGVSSQTLCVWACNGRYRLKYVKVGRRVMYRISELEAFIERRTVMQTGELISE